MEKGINKFISIIIIILLIIIGILLINQNNGKIITNKSTNINNSQNKEIKLLTDRDNFHLDVLIQDFENETGIKVKVNQIEHGILEKIRNRNEGDIYITKNSTQVLEASKEGLLAPIDQSLLTDINPLYKGKDWTNMSFRDRVFYIKKGIKSYPKNYEDLSDPKYKGKICIRSLTHNYNIELISYMYKKHGKEYTKKWLEGVIDNLGRKPVGNDRNQVKGVVIDKVCDIAVVNTYYMGLMLNNPNQRTWANGVEIFFPNQNSTKNNIDGSVALFSAIGINKNTKNIDNVNTLIKFLLKPLNQQFISNSNYEYPIVGQTHSNMVNSFGLKQGITNEKDIKMTTITQEDITLIRNDVIKLIKKIEIEKGL